MRRPRTEKEKQRLELSRTIAKQKRQLQKQVLHSVLDLLEFDKENSKLSPLHAPAKLYAQMLAGTLLRSLTLKLNLPKSTKRARALGIVVNPSDPMPSHEKKIYRKRLTKPVRYSKAYQDDDRDEGELI